MLDKSYSHDTIHSAITITISFMKWLIYKSLIFLMIAWLLFSVGYVVMEVGTVASVTFVIVAGALFFAINASENDPQ